MYFVLTSQVKPHDGASNWVETGTVITWGILNLILRYFGSEAV